MSGQAPSEVIIDGFVIESGSTLDRGAPLSADHIRSEVREYLTEGLAEPEPTIEVDPSLTPAGQTPAVSDAERAADRAAAKANADAINRGEDPPAPTAPKDKKQLRVDELQGQVSHYTREKHAAAAEAEQEQKRLNQLRAERLAEEQLATQRRTGAAATPAPAAAAPAADDLMPDWEGYDEAGKSFKEFQKDQAAWISRDVARRTEAAVAAVMSTVDQRSADAEQAKVEEAIDQRHSRNLKQLHTEKPDFSDLIAADEFRQMPRNAFLTALIKLHDKGPDVLYALAKDTSIGYSFVDLNLSPAMQAAFRVCDDPVALVTHLANNRGEAQRIANLDYDSALRAMYAIETQGSGAKTGTPAGPGAKTATPPLPARVGGARSVAGPKPLDQLSPDSEEDVSSYINRMNAEEGLPTL